MLGIDQVNNVVEGSRLTPALVPPVTTEIGKHDGEVTDSANARSRERRAGVGIAPSRPTVG